MIGRAALRALVGALCAILGFALIGALLARAAVARTPAITIFTDESSGPRLMGLGVEFDPYDSFEPTSALWNLTFRRLDFMRPGFLRVVEPAYDYFAGYDANGNPRYRWNAPHVRQLLRILSYAKSRGIAVVLGDWSNPMIHGDARVPADFLKQLHDVYGYTNIKYYNLINEPNDQADCDFFCWAAMVRKLSVEFRALRVSSWLQLVGPDNANSWDDTATARSLDRTSGLDTDNPIGGDSWVTDTLDVIPNRIGSFDSHRYATIWGIEHGVYGDQMRARREQISNADSPAKPYFEAEVGMTARQVSPFTAPYLARSARALAPLIDPSASPSVSTFVDSQPHIRQFGYGVWMGDMVIQAIAAGVSGLSAWDLDDAMHVGGEYGSQNLKQWGFWNSLGGRDGYPVSDLRLRPWYYPWSVLSRSFPSGSQPLVVPSTGTSGLRVAAAKIPTGGGYALSLAIANDSGVWRSIDMAVPSARSPATFARYDYFARDRRVNAAGFAVPARIFRGVVLARGVHIKLPPRGLAVLTSVGFGQPAPLVEGTRRLIDNLDNWRETNGHTRGLRLAHGDPVYFDGDRSLATSTAKRPQYIVYDRRRITSFELKAYFQGALELRVFRSSGGGVWIPVRLASTNPAPTLGGHGWYLAELLPRTALPAGTNRLIIELTGRSTRLSEVGIAYSGPATVTRSP